MNKTVVPMKQSEAGALDAGGGQMPTGLPRHGIDWLTMAEHHELLDKAALEDRRQIHREQFIIATLIRFKDDPGVTVTVKKNKVVIEVVR